MRPAYLGTFYIDSLRLNFAVLQRVKVKIESELPAPIKRNRFNLKCNKTFKIFQCAGNDGKKFPKFSQTSFRGMFIVSQMCQ